MKWAVAITLLLTPFSRALCWGALGHRIVGELAQRQLSPKARATVGSLLGKESLAEAAVWSDEIRSDRIMSARLAHLWNPSAISTAKAPWEIPATWHYMEISNPPHYDPSSRPPEGDLLWAIERVSQVLQGKLPSSPKEKKYALRTLAHLIGDLHQPLHVGNGRDRGANTCLVNWLPRKTWPKLSDGSSPREDDLHTLHRVWDEAILEKSTLSYREYADRIEGRGEEFLKGLAPEKEKLTPLSWALESRGLHERAYPPSPEKFCSYEGAPIDRENIFPFDWDAFLRAQRIIERQLFKAGHRLAFLLNSLFSNGLGQ